MEHDKEKERAKQLLLGMRGNYIIGKALAVAYRELSKAKGAMKPKSDLNDMKMLGEHIFHIGWDMEMQYPVSKYENPENDKDS